MNEARVIKAKGVTFNYLQIIWGILQNSIKYASAGDYASALKNLCVNIGTFPSDVREKFGARTDLLMERMNLIVANRIPPLQAESDLYLRGIKREKLLQNYTYFHYRLLMADVMEMLEEKGYLECSNEVVPMGSSHTWR